MSTIDFSPVFAQFLEVVLGVAIPALTIQVFRVAMALRELYQKRVNAEVQEFIEQHVIRLIKAAEKLETTKRIAAGGENKFNWVVSEASQFFARYNINVDEKTLRTIIEAAINDGLHKGITIFDTVESNNTLG